MSNILERPNIIFVPNMKPEETYEDRYWALSSYARSIGKAFNAKYYPCYVEEPIQLYMSDIMSFVAKNKHIAVEENYKDDDVLPKVLAMFDDAEIHVYHPEPENITPPNPPVLED